jgi:hypothetical protein
MINGKNLEHRPIEELMSIVKRDLKRINEQGLIDEGSCVKTIMYCNDTFYSYQGSKRDLYSYRRS